MDQRGGVGPYIKDTPAQQPSLHAALHNPPTAEVFFLQSILGKGRGHWVICFPRL